MKFDNYFTEPGAYVLVDGQFGSTGKGLLAAYIATLFRDRIGVVTTNAGPNSGHTAYWEWDQPEMVYGGHGNVIEHTPEPEKVMTQQIPVASVFLEKMGRKPLTYLNAGAIIDDDILSEEIHKWLYPAACEGRVGIHPCAAMILPGHRDNDQLVLAKVAGTGKGVGPAIQAKIGRETENVAMQTYHHWAAKTGESSEPRPWSNFWNWEHDVVFVETAQGFSLGLNEARFYPHVTSRECTVGQALADARIPAKRLKKVIASLRTFPIRVGNTTGSSGGYYPDQQEIEWKSIGQEPELTTVTKRKRRLFTWSWVQFEEMLRTNEPDVLFINFVNYLTDPIGRRDFLQKVMSEYHRIMHRAPDAVLLGHGPLVSDIEMYWKL